MAVDLTRDLCERLSTSIVAAGRRSHRFIIPTILAGTMIKAENLYFSYTLFPLCLCGKTEARVTSQAELFWGYLSLKGNLPAR